MGLHSKYLGRDEIVLRHVRTHVKALLGPAAALIVLAAGLGLGLGLLPGQWRPWSIYALIAVFVVLVVWLVCVPFLRWLTTTYTITDRRVITRSGIITRTGHDLPLRRISNVTYERSIVDRMLGCGTLVFETAAEQPLTLPDVPDVERVHVEVTEVLFGDDGGPDDLFAAPR